VAQGARDTEDIGTVPPPAPAPVVTFPRKAPARNTVRDTWSWLWKDTLVRIVPFMAAGVLYTRLSDRTGQRDHRGQTGGGVAREVLAGVALGVPMAALAASFRAWVAPGYRLPTTADQALQTAYYFAINAPAEELFWRGTVQSATIRALRHAPRVGAAANPIGWALTTVAFGAYHRLGHWSWRAIGGVTLAGGLFGALHLAQPRRTSIVLPAIVHGFATAGFLSWGDVALDLKRRRGHGRQR
jgi:uncharacterized protein